MGNDAYISIVRSALWGKESIGWPEQGADALFSRCVTQGTGALVFQRVLENESVSLSSSLRTQMKAVCVQTMQRQAHWQHVLAMSWAALTKAGIEPVLLKGVGLAAYYPSPAMRSCGDIDIFVGKQYYHPACAAMREAFPEAWHFREEGEHYKHYNIEIEDIPVELHRVAVSLLHPLDKRRFARMEERGLGNGRRFMADGLSVRVPEPTFNALFVFLHAWQHTTGGSATMRHLCDLALLLHHEAGRIDGRRLKADLRALCLMDVWQVFMYMLVQHLGLPEADALFYTEACAPRAERLLQDILHPLPHQPRTVETKNRWARKWYTMQGRLADAKRVEVYSPAYARHMRWTTLLHGVGRIMAKDRQWE